MPRKMSGMAMSMMDESMVANSTPTVVLDRAIHLYRSPRGSAAVPRTSIPAAAATSLLSSTVVTAGVLSLVR